MSNARLDVPDLLARIRLDPHVHSFFAQLWDEKSDAFRRMFFAHRGLLFPLIEELNVPIPLLFFGHQVSSNADQVIAVSAETRAAKQEVAVRRYEGDGAELPSDIKRLFALLALRLIERNDHLHELLHRGDVNWASIGAALARNKLDTEIFGELRAAVDSSTASGPLDEHLLGVLRRYGEQLKGLVSKGEMIRLIRGLDSSANLLAFYALGAQHISKLQSARSLQQAAYQTLLQDLYLRRLLSNIETTFWCGTCVDDSAVLNTTGRLAPDQLVLACPKCKSAMNAATMYEPHELLREAILLEDGLLSVAIAWLLERKKIPYQRGAYAGDQELDYLVGADSKTILVEVKMHKTHKDEETTERNLNGDVKQAIRHIAAAKNKGISLSEAWVVTNYGHDSAELRRKALNRFNGEIGENSVRLLTPPEFSSFLDERGLAGSSP